jgi:hypothetical protein
MTQPKEAGAPQNDQQQGPIRLHRIGQAEVDLVITTKDEPPALVPEGKYQVQCLGWEKHRYYGGTMKLYVRFRICDGPYTDTALYRAFNYYDHLGSATDLYKTLVRVHGRRVTKKTRLPLALLKNKILEAKIRTVTKDHKQNPLPEHQQYSVIDEILTVLAGGGGA